MSIYQVKDIPSADFSKANLLNDFCFPWIDRDPPRTEFRALHDGVIFHFQFDVEDADLVISEPIDSDRVEIFIASDEKMSPYYGFEMAPDGRVHDFKASYHRQFDFDWKLAELKTVGKLTDDGYTLTGHIPLKTLRDLKCLQADGKMMTGVYRAEFSHGKTEGEIIHEWISWVDPKTETPDFHVPASFGTFVFE